MSDQDYKRQYPYTRTNPEDDLHDALMYIEALFRLNEGHSQADATMQKRMQRIEKQLDYVWIQMNIALDWMKELREVAMEAAILRDRIDD